MATKATMIPQETYLWSFKELEHLVVAEKSNQLFSWEVQDILNAC